MKHFKIKKKSQWYRIPLGSIKKERWKFMNKNTQKSQVGLEPTTVD